MMNEVEYAVIGSGLSGASTAWALAEAGHEVLILDQSISSSPLAGQGTKAARVFRHAYLSRFQTDLAAKSSRLWHEIEERSEVSLIVPAGAFDFGALQDIEHLAENMHAAGLPHEVLDGQEVRARWPQFDCSSHALWDPTGGVLDAELAAVTLIDLALESGATIRTGWQLHRCEELSSGGFRMVSTSGEVVTAANLVVAPGSSIESVLRLLPLQERSREAVPVIELQYERAFHFSYRDSFGGTELWPSFLDRSPGRNVYGLGRLGAGNQRSHKLAEFGLPSSRAGAPNEVAASGGGLDRVVEYVRRYLPGLNPEPDSEARYQFTYTPDDGLFIDRAGRITIVSPCSGHGAKFAPVIGAMAARFAIDQNQGDARFSLSNAKNNSLI